MLQPQLKIVKILSFQNHFVELFFRNNRSTDLDNLFLLKNSRNLSVELLCDFRFLFFRMRKIRIAKRYTFREIRHN